MSWSLLCGDVLEGLAALPDASFDACLCDPPYGLSDPPDTAEVLRHWLEDLDFDHRRGGFMGATWDSFVPGPRVWREVLRVLKPGGHLFAFGGTRTYDLLTVAVRLAGFEIRDSFLVPGAAWLHGQGFSKGINISKAIDKEAGAEREVIGHEVSPFRVDRAEADRVAYGGFKTGIMADGYRAAPITRAATEAAARWEGYNSTLKPAWEPVLCAMRPLDGTYAQNAVRHGVSGLNIDGGRIGTMTKKEIARSGRSTGGMFLSGSVDWKRSGRQPLGRWPANLVLVHHPDCREVGTRRVRTGTSGPESGSGWQHGGYVGGAKVGRMGEARGYADADGREETTAWECAPDCPVGQLDRQAGERSSGGGSVRMDHAAMGYGGGNGSERELYGDTGSASRFFYCSKVSRGERERGLLGHVPCVGCRCLDSTHHVDAEGREVRCQRNVHPTLKPIDLCRYFATLLLPPKRLPGEPPRRLIVPFSGSGSEIIGALLAGWDQVVGIEQSLEDCNVARHRIGSADPEHVAAQPVRMAAISGPLFEEASE